MPLDLGRRLLESGVVQSGELRRAVFESLTRGKPLARALADSSSAARALLQRPLEGAAHPSMRAVVPQADLLRALPAGMAARLLAVPVRKDPRTGTVDVAVVDPLDPHVEAELAFHLGAPVRLIAAPLAEVERAVLLVGRPPPKDPLSSTADYAAAPPSITDSRPEQSPRTEPGVAPVAAPASTEEDAVPLVRRSRATMRAPKDEKNTLRAPPPPPSAPPQPVRVPTERPPRVAPIPAPVANTRPAVTTQPQTSLETTAPAPRAGDDRSEAVPLSRRRDTARPPTTDPYEQRKEPAVQMVVDFRAASREERAAAAQARPAAERKSTRVKLEPKRPPFPSLTPVLEAIDVAQDRDALIAALLRGIATTSAAAALFAPRRGKLTGLGAAGNLDPARVRAAPMSLRGALADAIARGERIGTLDPVADRELYDALALERFTSVHVLLHPAFVADKPALMLASYGMGDVLESSRRARVLATAAAAAMERLLRR
ncbi:MAG: hypothetical protein HYV09_04550 [Deltaproteobacteria bacterium]|nr:hypothetical protein [Deltaproteobacteria bacterium]